MYLSAWQGLGLKEFCRPASHPLPFPLAERHTAYFHTARSGVYYLFKELVKSGRSVVLVPDYHMGNEVRAVRAAGAEIVWYPATDRFEIDMEALRACCRCHRADVLFVIHYAGWPQPMGPLRALCDEYGLLLVEDCAMAFLTTVDEKPLGTFGDYAVFCLYKTLPLPDGAVLVQNRNVLEGLSGLPLRRSGRVFVAGRLAELGLERLRSRHAGIGKGLLELKQDVGRLLTCLRIRRVPVGDTGFDLSAVDIGMAPWSHRLLHRLDYAAIKNRRRRNFDQLKQVFGGEAVRTDLPQGVCPLFFPLLVRDKSRAAQALWRRGIMATELWNEGDETVKGHEGGDARFLRRHVLELPIHQDITPLQVDYMARQVKDAGITLSAEPVPCTQFQTA